MKRLTQLVLASSCLMMVLPGVVFAAIQDINVNVPTPLDVDGETEGVNFTKNGPLTVANGENIGSTGGVSVFSANIVNVPEIEFQGSSIVTGDITPGGPHVNRLTLQGGLGTTVTLNGVTELTPGPGNITFTKIANAKLVVNQNLILAGGGKIDFDNFAGTQSSVTFANGADFTGNVATGIVNTGSVLFLGNSTVTGGVLGSNNALSSVSIGSGTVHLNTVGIHQAKNFNFTSSEAGSILKLANNVDIIGNIDNTSGTESRGILLLEGTSSINGNIGATKPLDLIQMSNVTSQITVLGNVNATSIQLTNTGGNENTLKLSGTLTNVTTNIVTAADGVGIVDLDRVATFTGNIGESTRRVNEVQVGANNDTTVTGNIHAKSVTFQGARTLTISDNKFINGLVLGTGGSAGDLVFAGSSQSFNDLGSGVNPLNSVSFNSGIFNLNHDITATNTNVRNNATLIFNQSKTITGNLNLEATGANVQVGANTINITGNLVTNNNTDIIGFDLTGDKTKSFGNLAITGSANFNNISKSAFNISTSGFVPNGSVFPLVTTGVAILPANLPTVNASTLLSNFALGLDVTGNIVQLTVTRNTNTSIADTPFTLGVAGALDVIQNDPILINNPDILPVIDQLDNFTTRAEFNEALATLAPSVDGDNAEGMMAITRLGVETIRERLDQYRLGQLDYHYTGYAAGSYNTLKDYGVWVKMLASRLKQTEYKGVEGYKSDIWGIAGGVDYTSPDNEVVLGMGLTYASTESLSRSTAASANQVDTYSFMLYGTYNFNNPWYLDGIFYFSNHDYDHTRHILVGGVSREATAKYKAWQMSARAETGFVYKYNKVLFQPILSLFYSHLDRDDYTEEGAGGLNLVVRPRDINSLRLSVGPKISSVLGVEGTSIIPEFHAYYNFELANSKEQYQSNFVVGGPVFETDGIEAKRGSYIVGAGLSAYGFESLSCHVSLDYEFNKTKFSAFHGTLKFKYTWR